MESAAGHGSTFHFTGRFGLGRNVGAARWAEFARLRNLPALVVDDNSTNRHILVEVLRRWKMIPTEADGGQRALDLLEQSKRARNPYAVILLDSQMPDVDGFAVAEFVKRDPELAGAVILMLTSGGQPGDAARCRQLGIAAYLMKPVKQSELLEAILLAFGAPSGPSPLPLVTRHSLREERRRLRILLAEDNPVNQALVMRLLEKRGHTVEVAANGREALEALEGASLTRFDLILMDMLMPEMEWGGVRRTHPGEREWHRFPGSYHRLDRPRHEGGPRALPGPLGWMAIFPSPFGHNNSLRPLRDCSTCLRGQRSACLRATARRTCSTGIKCWHVSKGTMSCSEI